MRSVSFRVYRRFDLRLRLLFDKSAISLAPCITPYDRSDSALALPIRAVGGQPAKAMTPVIARSSQCHIFE